MNKPKKTCVFLRGLVREAGHWGGFLEKFSKAFPDTNVLALDLPGNGMRFKDISPLSIHEMAASVREDFLRSKGEENHLFAISLGAMVGIEWLRSWPEDFQSAVLVNTSLRGLSPIYQRLRPSNYPRILKMLFSKDPEYVERNILALTSHSRERFAELTELWVKIQKERPVSSRNAIRQIIAAARFHPPQEKPSLPILVLGAAGDELVNPSCSEAIAHAWSLPLRMHPRGGHDLTLDEPEWVLDQLKEFRSMI